MNTPKRATRWIAAAVIAVLVAAPPVQAHFAQDVGHLANHVWSFVRARVFTKAQANKRFVGNAARPWAKVSLSGGFPQLLNGRAVDEVNKMSPGQFRVVFKRDVDACGWVATLNGGVTDAATEISAQLEAFDDTVLVRTRDSAGALADPSDGHGFTLLAIC